MILAKQINDVYLMYIQKLQYNEYISVCDKD